MTEKEMLARWVENWKEAGKELEKIRREEIRAGSVQETIFALTDAFESAIRHNPPKPTSGLVEQQRLFKSWKRNAKVKPQNHNEF